MLKSNSPASRAFRRFLRNKPAVIGLMVIVFSAIIALLGYQITPDSTPDANDQVLQITNKAPGFTVKMLRRTKNKHIERKNFFTMMIHGCENPYELIPIHSYRFEGDKIIYEEYTGEHSGTEKTLELADVAFPLSVQNKPVTENESVTFYTIDEQKHILSTAELRSKVEDEHIITRTFHLGTDKFGRDIFSRLIIGVRVSLSVGIIAVVISVLIGILIGAIAGYFRGFIDEVCMWFINVVWSIPTLLLVFAIALALGRGFWQIFIAVGLTMWVDAARIIRGQVMSLREMQYIEAARSLGYSHLRTIGIHILPNVLGPLMVVSAANFASAILIEAGLSFLGIGVQPPTPSWGSMLSENYGYIIGANPFLAIIPGMAIMLMVLAFNVVGNGLRDALDVRTSLVSES
ncbi:MAG TPA: ABC transporter permease [Chitinophagales bacterium]|nr:ABC transporter permease [Chitinophagales bacterium]